MPVLGEGQSGFVSRRGFIRVVAAGALAATLPGCNEERQALGFTPAAKTRTPYVTPNEDFYLVAVDPDFRPRFGPAEAVDGHGEVQTAERQGPRPDGASGYHTIEVDIAAQR